MLECWDLRAEIESKRRYAGILKNAGMLGLLRYAGMLGFKKKDQRVREECWNIKICWNAGFKKEEKKC